MKEQLKNEQVNTQSNADKQFQLREKYNKLKLEKTSYEKKIATWKKKTEDIEKKLEEYKNKNEKKEKRGSVLLETSFHKSISQTRPPRQISKKTMSAVIELGQQRNSTVTQNTLLTVDDEQSIFKSQFRELLDVLDDDEEMKESRNGESAIKDFSVEIHNKTPHVPNSKQFSHAIKGSFQAFESQSQFNVS